jgi:hypothetical protein
MRKPSAALTDALAALEPRIEETLNRGGDPLITWRVGEMVLSYPPGAVETDDLLIEALGNSTLPDVVREVAFAIGSDDNEEEEIPEDEATGASERP